MKASHRWLMAAAWVALVSAGFVYMLVYEATPGAERPAPQMWPAPTAVKLSAKQPTLLMFIHPKCPCSRASIDELAKLMTRGQGLVEAHVLFTRPKGESDDWVKSDLWRSAAAIPGVSVQIDEGGRIAQQFGADTSGRAVLYDPKGQLAFSGGITESRGHAGDNEGLDAVIALLHHKAPLVVTTPTYGCALTSALCLTNSTVSISRP